MDETGTGIGLAEAIGQVRSELERAIVSGANSTLGFRGESVELELDLAFSRKGGADAGVRVWVLSIGAKAEVGSSRTHRVKIALTPFNRATGEQQDIRDTGKQ